MSLALASLASAGLGALQSIYTSNQNKKAVQATNNMNLQIARETNQANADLYQQQFRDQLYMQKMQNEYNSASAQVQRLREAGLNPALSFGDSSTVAPLSVPSAAPAQTGAPMQPYLQNVSDTPVSQALGALSSLTGSSKDFEEAKRINIGNQYEAELLQQKLNEGKVSIDEALERIKNSRMDRKQKAAATRKLIAESVNLDFLNEITKNQMGDLSRSAELQNKQTIAQTHLLEEQILSEHERQLTEQLSRQMSVEANSRAYQELASIVAKNFAEANLANQQRRLTEKDIENYWSKLENQIQNNLLLRQTIRHNEGKDWRESDAHSLMRSLYYQQIEKLMIENENPSNYVPNIPIRLK